jgi:hypothetical protein
LENIEHEENFCQMFLIDIQLLDQILRLILNGRIRTSDADEIFQSIEVFLLVSFAKLKQIRKRKKTDEETNHLKKNRLIAIVEFFFATDLSMVFFECTTIIKINTR